MEYTRRIKILNTKDYRSRQSEFRCPDFVSDYVNNFVGSNDQVISVSHDGSLKKLFGTLIPIKRFHDYPAKLLLFRYRVVLITVVALTNSFPHYRFHLYGHA